MSFDGIPGIPDVPTVSSAVSTVSNAISAGPASSLSAVSNAVTGAVNAVGNLFQALGGQKLPLPNPLFDYASYTYVLGIGILTDAQVNHPDKTYKKGAKVALLAKTANTDPENRVNTPYGKFDFFIDNLEMTSQIGIGLENITNNTNVMNFKFDIIEPYSMGLFMIAVQQLAQEKGHDNWMSAPFLLTIDFRGNKETGAMSKIPGTHKDIAFSINDVSMKVNHLGAVYTLQAQAWNQFALSDDVANIKTDHTVSGKTVQELLQSGRDSLEVMVNARAREMVDKGIVEIADQYLIVFPSDKSSSSKPSEDTSNTELQEPPTKPVQDVANAETVYSDLNVSKDAQSGVFVQSPGDCNEIGQSKMGFDEKRKADPPGGKDNLIYKDGTWIRANLNFDSAVSEMRFTQDTSIPTAISQVILNSTFSENNLDPSKVTAEGYVGWWKITTQVYNIGTKPEKGTGEKAKLIVYSVIPTKAHISRAMPPNKKAPGTAELAKKATKEYNYIYTGKNVDVIKFDIAVKTGFTLAMATDSLTRTAGKVSENSTGGTESHDKNIKPLADGAPPSKTLGVWPTIVKYSKSIAGTDGISGGGVEGQGQRVAKLFQDALSNDANQLNLDLTIVGDPYWIAQSGAGNYTAKPSSNENLTSDGDVDFQSAEVHCSVNFRTPIDLNQATGLYDFGAGKSAPVLAYSGLYNVQTVTSTFKGGVFTQVIKGFRMPNFGNPEEGSAEDMLSATRVSDKESNNPDGTL